MANNQVVALHNNNAPNPRPPTPEVDCARICGYRYIDENEFSDPALLHAQETFVNTNYHMIGRYPPPCACSVHNNRKCTGSECPNRRRSIACSPDCGPFCQNNPWATDSFAIGRRTYLENAGGNIGNGLFACELIRMHEFLGEYTGIVIRRMADLDPKEEDADKYAFNLPSVKQVLDSLRQGSAARLCNHSCRPNVVVREYVHDLKVKIVFKAIRNIKPGDQLTLDYNWKYENVEDLPPCLCGLPECRQRIGYVRGQEEKDGASTKQGTKAPDKKGSRQRSNRRRQPQPAIRPRPSADHVQDSDNDNDEVNAPPEIPNEAEGMEPAIDDDDGNVDNEELVYGAQREFPSVLENATAEVLRIFSADPIPLPRPDNYVETHEFSPMSSAFTLIDADGITQIAAGRVIRCYLNRNGLVIFVIRIVRPGQVDLHVPQLISFHFMEDAIFRRRYLFSEDDRQAVSQYVPSPRGAEDLENQLVPDYAQRLRHGDLPYTVMHRIGMLGPIAIGLPTHELMEIPDPRQIGAPGVDAYGLPVLNSRRRKQVARKQPRISIAKEPVCRGDDDLSTTTSTSSRGQASNPSGNIGYSPSVRQNIDTVRRRLENVVNLQRLFTNAVESVAIFAQSRYRRNLVSIDHTDISNRVRQVLDWFYNLALPHQRRFLLYTHYRLATEAQDGGSMSINWCSLCGQNETFSNDKAMQRHFHERHSICAPRYTCPGKNCGMETSLPSVFRTHVRNCTDRDFPSTLRSNVENEIIDAFADFVACKDKGGHQLYLITPGLPYLRSNEQGGGPSHKKGAKSAPTTSVQMDLSTRRPTDRNVQMKPAAFPVQKTYTELKDWTDLRYASSSIIMQRDPAGLVNDGERPGPSRDMYKSAKSSTRGGGSGSGKKRSRSTRRRDESDKSEDDNCGDVRRTRSRTKSTSKATKRVVRSGSRHRGQECDDDVDSSSSHDAIDDDEDYQAESPEADSDD